MLRTDVISDDLWDLVEPILPAGVRRGRPWNDHRRTLEGIVWRFRTGSPWRDLPEHISGRGNQYGNVIVDGYSMAPTGRCSLRCVAQILRPLARF